MATNWGITTDLATDSDVNFTRAMSGVLPATASMILDSVSIYCGIQHSGQVRVAVYQGGSSSDPAGASLLEDLGLTSGSVINTWQVLTSSTTPALASGGRIWIVVKCNDSAFGIVYSSNSADAGDFRSDVGRWNDDTISSAEDTAYPATWPANSGSFANYWYSFYLTYSISGAGGRVTKNTRAFPLGEAIGMPFRF